ncbi:MAG: transporter, partial [Thiotrichaceae bacterium]|nr:transporter [Thiotrichaceae bacterium]
STDATGGAMTGGNSGNPSSPSLVPNFYYANALSDRWTVGFAFNVPFGNATEYDSDWAGRYYDTTSSITSINFNPGVGFKVDEMLSIGAGISINYTTLELSQAIDFGSLLGKPQNMDGAAKLEGDDWGVGFNLGILLTFSESTRLGIAYRSHIKLTAVGDADFTVPENIAALVQARGGFTNTTFTLPASLPESISLSLYHQLTPRLAAMTDLTYTRWSRIQEFRSSFDNPAQAESVTAKNWENTWRIAVGFDYSYTPAWRFQAGVAYDENAIPDDTFDPRTPNSETIRVSLGTHYQYSDALSFGVAYSRVMRDEHEIALIDPKKGTLNGDIDFIGNLFGVEVDWRF